MKNFRILSVFATFGLLVLSAIRLPAQTSNFQNQISHVQHDPPSMGRDYWFALLTNYTDAGGKYFALYVTSPQATTVYVTLGGTKKTLFLQPFKPAVYNIPLAFEMTSSGKVENLAIHVWSDSADIACSVMSHNPYTSDGMTLIPPIGWGKDYVVAGYASLFEGFGSQYDLPSEFIVVANQDNTQVTITPSADMRVEDSSGAGCSNIFGNKGQPKNVMLNRGQCIQIKTTCTQDCDNFDLTGTLISSTKPVGLIAGSQCPNIPCDFPYCDHVCEMIPPIRTWATTYYTLPFFQPRGASDAHSASTFVVIPTLANQTIYRSDSNGTTYAYYTSSAAFEPYWRNDVSTASKWFSAEPFLLVQYINSSTYPDNVNGNGDPAEVVILAEEQFFKTSVFQLPVSIGNQSPYVNYVNVIADINDKNVQLDGKKLTGAMTIDGRYVGYRVAGLNSTGHVVTSDSGVGVYAYGFGFDESYAYSGQMGTASFNSPDTLPIPPDISINGLETIVTVRDTVASSGVYYIRTDKSQNMIITPGQGYVEGVPMQEATYYARAIDPSKAGSATVSTYDMGGNHTTITTHFDPSGLGSYITPFQQSVSAKQNATVYLYDTIINLGGNPLAMTSLGLRYGNYGFTIDSVDRSPIEGAGRRVVRIAYTPTNRATSTDSLVLGSAVGVLNGTMESSASVNDAQDKQQTLLISDDGRSLRSTFDAAAHIDLLTTSGGEALSADISPNGQLDVSTLAAGVYFYRLTAGGKVVSGKIVIP